VSTILADGYARRSAVANLKLFCHMVTKNSAVDVKWRASIFYAHALSVSASRRACTLIPIAGALIAHSRLSSAVTPGLLSLICSSGDTSSGA
jgi:hypothetical protein